MNYWQPGSDVWEYWRKYFKFSKEEALMKWLGQVPCGDLIKHRYGACNCRLNEL